MGIVYGVFMNFRIFLNLLLNFVVVVVCGVVVMYFFDLLFGWCWCVYLCDKVVVGWYGVVDYVNM